MRNCLLIASVFAMLMVIAEDASAQRPRGGPGQRGQTGQTQNGQRGQTGRRQAQLSERQSPAGRQAGTSQRRRAGQAQGGGEQQCSQEDAGVTSTSAQARFAFLDQNNDGIISIDEVPPNARQMFDQVDANNDGGCDMTELQKRYKTNKVSADKFSRGNVNELKAVSNAPRAKVKPIVGNVRLGVAMPTGPVKVGRGGGRKIAAVVRLIVGKVLKMNSSNQSPT